MAAADSSQPNSTHDGYDFEDDNSLEYDDYRDFYDQDSDEDTEDASETDMIKQEEEYTELKEQMYQDKLMNFKKQLQQLKDGSHPEYNRRLKKFEQIHKERLRLNEIFYKYEMECIEREFVSEKRASARDFEEKKIELRESLLFELDEKKKSIECERITMELTGDSMEVKTVTTRKLRRRPNDPLPLPEKRRKTSPAQLNYLLDENQILDDLKLMNKGKSIPVRKPSSDESQVSVTDHCQLDVRIEDGKLYYEKRWFHRGQPIYVESKESGKFSGVISAVESSEEKDGHFKILLMGLVRYPKTLIQSVLCSNFILVRKTTDNSKVRLHLSQLQKGKFTIRRRST